MSETKANKIVYRIKGGGTSVVQASAIQDVDDLAYAMGFLANHRLYKMSKDGGVTLEKAEAVAQAFLFAAERFSEEVIDPLGGAEDDGRISNLGDGEVKNPYDFIPQG